MLTTPATTRRRVLKAAAWTAPVVVLSGAAPAFAASGVSVTPHVSETTDMQTLIDQGIAPYLQYLPGYQHDGLPRCVPVDMRAFDIYFTAQRNGVDVENGSMTFVLSPGLVFDAPYSGQTATVTFTGGKAYPPKFRAASGNSPTTETITAVFESTESTPTPIPVSGYNNVCLMGNPIP